MRDFIENLEAGVEARYEEMLQPDGKLRCGCGEVFNPETEGGPVSSNPYAMPVCGNCFRKWWKEQTTKSPERK
jgi:hypothetical protein